MCRARPTLTTGGHSDRGMSSVCFGFLLAKMRYLCIWRRDLLAFRPYQYLVPLSSRPTLPTMKHLYKVIDYKPGITTMQKIQLVDNACALLERASGVKLHRDPSAGNVKFLALGRWRGTLSQEDIPVQGL
jgi:hypothetical protein